MECLSQVRKPRKQKFPLHTLVRIINWRRFEGLEATLVDYDLETDEYTCVLENEETFLCVTPEYFQLIFFFGQYVTVSNLPPTLGFVPETTAVGIVQSSKFDREYRVWFFSEDDQHITTLPESCLTLCMFPSVELNGKLYYDVPRKSPLYAAFGGPVDHSRKLPEIEPHTPLGPQNCMYTEKNIENISESIWASHAFPSDICRLIAEYAESVVEELFSKIQPGQKVWILHDDIWVRRLIKWKHSTKTKIIGDNLWFRVTPTNVLLIKTNFPKTGTASTTAKTSVANSKKRNNLWGFERLFGNCTTFTKPGLDRDFKPVP